MQVAILSRPSLQFTFFKAALAPQASSDLKPSSGISRSQRVGASLSYTPREGQDGTCPYLVSVLDVKSARALSRGLVLPLKWAGNRGAFSSTF